MSSHRFDVLISEVGPRDGLQSVASTMSTAHKLAWIDALAHSGLQEIEVGSFVSPKLLPQMADAAEVVAHAITLPGVTVMALVPNLRGAEAALRAGVHKVTLPVSASPRIPWPMCARPPCRWWTRCGPLPRCATRSHRMP